jgi:hypothetical protein
MKILLTTIFALIAILWLPMPTHAFSVSPAIIELSGERGEVIETQFRVINTGANEKEFYLSSMKFTPREEGGKPEFIPTEVDQSGLPEWIAFPSRKIVVPANSFLEVPVHIAIPTDVSSGGHYASFIVSEAPYEVVETNGASFNAKTAILIFLTVKGNTIQRASLLDFDTSVERRVLDRVFGDYTYRVQNQGNIHITPTASVSLTNIFGREILRVNANPTGGRVLPDSTRSFEGVFGSQNVDGFFGAIQDQLSFFALGPVTLTFEMDYGTETVSTESMRFWTIPWQLLLSFLVVVSLILAFVKVLSRKIN